MKFETLANKILDVFLLGLLLWIIFSIFLRCSTPPQTTVNLQDKATQTESAIDKGVDGCKSLECQEAMKQSKDYIRESLDTVKSRDREIIGLNEWIQSEKEKYQSEIWELKEQIRELESEVEPWRTIKRWFYYTLAAICGLILLYIAYRFRSTIFELIKALLKLS